MTHIRTVTGRKKFVCTQVKRASPKTVARIYAAVEKVTGYHKKRKTTRRYARKTTKRYSRRRKY